MPRCSGCASVIHSDSDCILISGAGTADDRLEIEPIIDPDPDNNLFCGPDGMFVPPVEDVAVFTRTGVLTIGTGVSRWRFPFAASLLGVSAAVGVAPTGTSIIVDVNKNGTTIFTTQANRPTIPISTFHSGTEDVPDVTTIVAGDYLTIDRDQVGSTIAGEELTIFIRYTR